MEMKITPEWLKNKIENETVEECAEAGLSDLNELLSAEPFPTPKEECTHLFESLSYYSGADIIWRCQTCGRERRDVGGNRPMTI